MFTHDARVSSLITDGWHIDAATLLADTGFYHAPIPVLNLYHRIVCCSCEYDVEKPSDANAAIELHFYYGKESCQWKLEATREHQRVQEMEQQLRQAGMRLTTDVQLTEQQTQRNFDLEELRLRLKQENEHHSHFAEQVPGPNTTDNLFACRRCPARFTSNSKLHHHIKAHHTKPSSDPVPPPQIIPAGTRTFTCRRCYVSFPSNTKLHVHLKEHRNLCTIKSKPSSDMFRTASATAPSSEPSPRAYSFAAAQNLPSTPKPSHMDTTHATPPPRPLPTPFPPSKFSSSSTSPALSTASLSRSSIAEPTTGPAPPPIPWHTKPKPGLFPDA